jgi:hypothetical protein
VYCWSLIIEATGHAVYCWSLIIRQTMQANLNHYWMVGSSFATAFGPGFSFNKRWQMLPVRPRRVPLSVPGCIARRLLRRMRENGPGC